MIKHVNPIHLESERKLRTSKDDLVTINRPPADCGVTFVRNSPPLWVNPIVTGRGSNVPYQPSQKFDSKNSCVLISGQEAIKYADYVHLLKSCKRTLFVLDDN